MTSFSPNAPVPASATDRRAATSNAAGAARARNLGNQARLRRLAADGAKDGGGKDRDSSAREGLVIGDQNDPLEREADQVADQVMRASAPVAPLASTEPKIHRKCSACEDEEKSPVRAKAADAAPAQAGQAAPAAVHDVLASPGRQLDAPLRDFFEPRFGADFGAVRMHTDAEAGASAHSVGALAYAVDNHVVVDPDHYRPDSDSGRRLLAHELTHTLQQGDGAAMAKLRRADDDGSLPAEAPEAEPLEEDDEIEDSDEEDDTEDGDTPVDGIDETPDFDLGSLPGLGNSSPDDPVAPPEAEPMATANQEVASADPAPQTPDEAEPEGRNPGKKPGGKISHIDVDQTTQRMVLTFANGSQSEEYVVSTGRGKCGTKPEDPCKSQNNINCTPNITKRLVTGRGTGTQKNGHGDRIWWFVGLDTPGRTGIGIHNSQKADGIPRSHGCIRTGKEGTAGDKLAEMINKQVMVKKTTVTITGKAKTHPYACKKAKGKKKGGGKGKK